MSEKSGAPHRADRNGDDGNSRFARQIAGVYFGSATSDCGGDCEVINTITIHANGTYVAQNTDGDSEDGTASIEQGVWERTGHREISFKGLIYQFDAAGVLQSFSKPVGIVTFSRDFNRLTGIGRVDIYLADQNPLSDEAVASIPGLVFEAERLR